MSDIEVKALAAMVKAPVDVLMRQLERAGIEVGSPEDKITDAQKLMLLERMSEGTETATKAGSAKKITLKKRGAEGGALGLKKPGVDVRRKKTISLRKPNAEPNVDVEAEARAEALAQQAEAERLAREEVIQRAERERRELEAMRLSDDPESAEEEAAPAGAAPAEAAADAETGTDAAAVADESTVVDTAAEGSNTEAVEIAETAAVEAAAEADSAPVAEEEATAAEPVVTEATAEAQPEQAPAPAAAEPATSAAEAAAAPKPELTGMQRRQAVAEAAKREAAAALKRRPSRPKPPPKPAAAPAPAAAATETKPSQPNRMRAAPSNDGPTISRKGKKKGRNSRERENLRGNARGGRRKEPQIDRGEIKHGFEKPTAPVVREIEVPASIVVSDLAQKLAIRATDIIKVMMKMGMMVTINQSIDQDTAILVAEDLGHVATPMQEMDDEAILASVLDSDDEFDSMTRPPVVTIMGHVDHGKTSLLDYIRESRVASGEAGGITQHIGAYHVDTEHGTVSFLDTPGHAAFTKMRARGAQVTDIVILIVAADDGVMPQTKEAIEHAKAAGVPMIVAINKMDKEAADPDRVLNELSQHEVLTEDWGGDVPVVRVSAKTGQGIEELLETILLVSEVQELTAPVDAPAKGTVIEASVERGRGVVATVLVREGTLKKGDILLCGTEYGRVRALFDERGRSVKEAGPSIPVSVLGLSSAPEAGDEAFVVSEERKAREIAEMRKEKLRDSRFAAQQSAKLDNMFNQMEAGDTQQVNLLLKADVQGSVEAIRSELTKLSTEEVSVNIIASGVGGMSESDIDLAAASKAIVVAFNVRADATARKSAQESDVEIRYYSIIYDVVNDIRDAMSGLLSPETKEVFTGLAEVKDVFKSSDFGQVAGCLVVEGSVKKGNPIRVLRDNVVIFEGELESLRRHRDDVNEVNVGTECGIAVKNYTDVKAGDQIEVFEYVEVARTI